MAGFVQGVDREQVALFPARLDEYVAEDNPVRAVDDLSTGSISMGLASSTFNRLISAGPAIIRG
jgi:transposase